MVEARPGIRVERGARTTSACMRRDTCETGYHVFNHSTRLSTMGHGSAGRVHVTTEPYITWFELWIDCGQGVPSGLPKWSGLGYHDQLQLEVRLGRPSRTGGAIGGKFFSGLAPLAVAHGRRRFQAGAWVGCLFHRSLLGLVRVKSLDLCLPS